MNYDGVDTEFVLRVDLRGHDTLMWTAMYVMPIFHWELSWEDILGGGP